MSLKYEPFSELLHISAKSYIENCTERYNSQFKNLKLITSSQAWRGQCSCRGRRCTRSLAAEKSRPAT